jgi:hypothetical protein
MSTSQAARYKRLAQDSRRRARESNEALEAAIARITELEQSQATHDELTQEVEGLYATAREGALRSEWEKAALAQGVDPEALDDLWKVAAPEADPKHPDAEPDPKALARHVKESLKTRQWAKAETDDEEGEEDETETDEDGEEIDKLVTALDLAPKTKTAKTETATGTGTDGKPVKTGTEKPAGSGKLTAGEGKGRGGRDDHKPKTIQEKVDEDFAATGREDAFRI